MSFYPMKILQHSQKKVLANNLIHFNTICAFIDDAQQQKMLNRFSIEMLGCSFVSSRPNKVRSMHVFMTIVCCQSACYNVYIHKFPT